MSLTPAAFNPADKAAGITLSSSDRTWESTSGVEGAVRSAYKASTGKWYVEFAVSDDDSSFGVVSASHPLNKIPGRSAESVGFANSGVYINSTNQIPGTPFGQVGNTGMVLDLDAAPRTVRFIRGAITTQTYSIPWGGDVYIAGGVPDAYWANAATLNAGNASFSYTVPAGHIAGFGAVVVLASCYAAAPTPLGTPATLAASIRQAWGSAASPLGAPAILAASGENFFARAAAATPLGTPLALARAVGAAQVATAGPLGAGAALGQLVAVARAMAVGPLGAPVVMARTPKVQAVLYATGHLGTSHGTTAAELGYDAVLRPPGTRGTRYGFQAIVYTPVTLTVTVRQESSSGAVTRHGTPIATGATSLQATGAAPSTQHGTPNAMTVLRAAGHLAANHGTPGAGNVLRPAGRCGTNHGAVRITSTLHAVGHLATRRGTPTSTASTILMAHGHTDTQYGTPRVGTLTLRACFTAPGVRHGRPRIDRGATC